MKSAFAMYETLLENGINSQFQCFDEFNWDKASYKGETIILSGQVSLPSRYWEPLRNFVRNGGKLIMEGLSAFYDVKYVLPYITRDFRYKMYWGAH